jgi:hypothetical protein
MVALERSRLRVGDASGVSARQIVTSAGRGAGGCSHIGSVVPGGQISGPQTNGRNLGAGIGPSSSSAIPDRMSAKVDQAR